MSSPPRLSCTRLTNSAACATSLTSAWNKAHVPPPADGIRHFLRFRFVAPVMYSYSARAGNPWRRRAAPLLLPVTNATLPENPYKFPLLDAHYTGL